MILQKLSICLVHDQINIFIFLSLFVMDTPGRYTGWWHKKYISKKEIENMKKNMKKVPIINLKSDIYHKKEIEEAEQILEKIPQLINNWEIISDNNHLGKNWLKNKFRLLRKYFISLF